MPRTQANASARPRGRPAGSTNKQKSNNDTTPRARASTGFSRPSIAGSSTAASRKAQKQPQLDADSEPDPFADSQDAMDLTQDSLPANNHNGEEEEEEGEEEEEDDMDDEPQASIPPELLTRLLHEFFEKDGTRISKGANEAVAKYMDIFVREAIARAAVEKEGGFLEVDDLEKIAPQLLLDL
ncbi:hypothetical protein TruAng_009880 [Truncatella angustata]|nr:hypothetical protein TruAng_009880 [Truncatella angustata]